ncbi:MAG: LytR/AlgR family response regulator transcription factor [Eubacteriaceae bacterium]
MLKICVCDDNQKTAQGVASIVIKFCEKRMIEQSTKVYYDGKQLIESGETFDIIFLDVEMPEMDGIHAGKLIRKQNTNAKIIYITGYVNYMRNAFSVHAFDYLRKPFKSERVEQALEEALEYIDNETKNSSVSVMIQNGPVTFQTKDIYYFERYHRKIKIITVKGEMEISNHLEDIYESVKDKGFEICHKSYVVNLFHIQSIKGFEILLKNDDWIPLAQKRAVAFKKSLYDYLHEAYNII